jgi:hypothetical protein
MRPSFPYRVPVGWDGIRRATSTTWLHPRRSARLEVHDAQLFRVDARIPAMGGDFVAIADDVMTIDASGLDARLRVVTGRTCAGAPRTRAAAAISDHTFLYLVGFESTGEDLAPLLQLVATIRPVKCAPVVTPYLWSVE